MGAHRPLQAPLGSHAETTAQDSSAMVKSNRSPKKNYGLRIVSDRQIDDRTDGRSWG